MNDDGGSVSIVAAVLVGLLAVLVAGLGGLGQVMAARQTAQVAADAAALAAAPVTFRSFGASGSPSDEARRFAEANGARLVQCSGCEVDRSWDRRVVEIEVAISVDLLLLGSTTVHAVAAAEFVPAQLLGAP